MKRLLTIMMALLVLNLTAYGISVDVKFGIGSGEETIKFKSDVIEELNYEESYPFKEFKSLNLEFLKESSKKFEWGAGVSKISGMKYDDSDVAESENDDNFGTGSIGISSIYLVFKRNFESEESAMLYLKCGLGVSINTFDGVDTSENGAKLEVSDGGYFGLGVGVSFSNKMFVELMIESNTLPMYLKYEGRTMIETQSSITRASVFMGYRFYSNNKKPKKSKIPEIIN